MTDLVSSRLRRGGGPTASTTAYETHLGIVSLTWSRTLLGLSLLADLPLSSSVAAAVKLRLWSFRKRKGSKRFRVLTPCRRAEIEIAWDLTRAKFAAAGGPDPVAGFFVAVSVDSEMVLLTGDLEEKAKISPVPTPISRRERVKLERKGGRLKYSTTARFEGREREISIEVEGREEEMGMAVAVDGRRVLAVTRLGWKFRGSERVEGEGGDGIQVSWDLYNWFFRGKGEEKPEFGVAVFVVRFEREGGAGEEEGYFGKSIEGGYFGKSNNMNMNRSLSMSSSGSDSSSWESSSVCGSAVMEWASAEEGEMRKLDAFSLIVHASKH